jgi:hypothetical protein
MKKLFILSLLSVFSYGTISQATPHKPTIVQAQKDSLNVYVGRYQSIQKQGTFLIEVLLTEDGRLLANSLWDGNKYGLKHLTDDNFIIGGFDWSVKFLRSKDKKITQMLVKGTEYWDKVK